MFVFPNDYEKPWTLSGAVFRKGVGLHSGLESSICLLPSDEPGFHVSWANSSLPPIKLRADQVRNSPLCTTLQLGDYSLATVEHLLAALAGCGLSHVLIEVEGEEVPLLDGSALGWVEAIKEVGLISASSPRKSPPILEEAIVINKGTSVLTATPAQNFKLIGIIDFPYPAIGSQMFSIELSPHNFVKEIAPARTFGFVDQIEELKAQGLIKGGALDNALVCDGDNWINPPLRFDDEPVRHKILDLIGDLALVGFPKAQVLVYRGSHALHSELASALLNK